MYVLKTAQELVAGRSATPIVADLADDVFRSDSQVWYDPRPSTGGVVAHEPDPPAVPQEVQRRQALRAIFLQLGKTKADLLAMAAAQPEPARTLMSIDIEESNTFKRDNPTLAALAGALGLNGAQLDDLFILAGAQP